MDHRILLALGAMTIGCTSGGNAAAPIVPDAGDGGLIPINRSHLADAGTSGHLDYADPSLWVCRPGIDPNECYSNLDATELLPDGGRQVVPHQRATDPKFDCFYVYPTVDLTGSGNMTNFSDINYVLDPLLSQAARFSRICEVYAPLYRQAVLNVAALPRATGGSDAGEGVEGGEDAGGDGGAGDAGVGIIGGPSAALALQDVRDAFQYYLAHFNNGRKFVIMGHSQGSAMLAAMMQTDVDPMPQIRAQMISALLIGGGTTVAPGETTNGTFKNIPTCLKPGDTGCMVAYSSYDVADPPGSNALFGKSPDGQVACTNPGPLAGNAGPFQRSYFPTTVNNPLFTPSEPIPAGITTPFFFYAQVFQGTCVVDNGYSYLQVTLLESSGDPRGVPPYKNTAAEAAGFGLHLVDYNLPLEDLIDAVTQQAAAAMP